MHPDFSGVWRANFEKSVFRGVPPRQILNRIEHHEPHLDQEMLVDQADGGAQRIAFHYEATGDETINFVGDRAVRSRARWDDEELVIESWMETAGREFHFKDHLSLSGDGQTLTMAHRDDELAGQVVVHDKVARERIRRE